MWQIIFGLFELLLGVFAKLALDIVYKSLKILKLLLKENFVFWLCDWNSVLVAILMLYLSETYNVI